MLFFQYNSNFKKSLKSTIYHNKHKIKEKILVMQHLQSKLVLLSKLSHQEI